jgi:hypothetical protein
VVNRWVSVRFAFTGAVINFITGVIILLSVDRIDASLAGFCLSFVLLFTDQVKLFVCGIIKQFSGTHNKTLFSDVLGYS